MEKRDVAPPPEGGPGPGGSPDFGPRYGSARELGRGGVGVVYRAWDAHLGRDVAVKVAQDARGDGPLRAEYALLSELRHPGVVEVHDLGSTGDGRPFYTMELLAGGPLSAAPLPLRPADAAQLLLPAVEALQLLHERGLVHADLKPENLLLATPWQRGTPPPPARLADFGMAGRADTGEVRGTPTYLAPEMLSGGACDARSDLYSTGVMLFELIAGSPPFQDEDVARLLQRHVSQVPPAPSTLREDGATDLDAPVLRLLEKEPALRHASSAELAADLRRVAGGDGGADSVGLLRRYARSGRFVGRGPLVGDLLARLGASPEGRRGVVRVVGPAGTGRSHLLRAVHARLSELGWNAALVAPLPRPLDAIRAVLGALGQPVWEGIESLPEPLREAARVLRGEADSLAGSAGVDDARTRFVAAAMGLLRRVPSLPHAVLVDLPESVDAASMAFMEALGEDVGAGRLSLLVAQPGDAAPDSTAAIPLLPFDEAAIPAFLDELLGEVDQGALLAGPLHAATGGRPEALLAALQRASEHGVLYRGSARWFVDPAALRSLPEGALDPVETAAEATALAALPSWALSVLEAAAVLGDPFAPGAAARMVACNPADLGAALTLLGDEGWIRRQRGGTATFTGGRLRNAVRAAIPGERRRELHRTAARVLSQGAGTDARSREIAGHLVEAGAVADAVPWIEAAVARDVALGDPEGALRLLEGARRCLPEGESSPLSSWLDERVADLALSAGRPSDAVEVLQRLLGGEAPPPLGESGAAPAHGLRWRQRLGEALAQGGRFREALECLAQAAVEIPPGDGRARLANLLERASARMMSGENAEARTLAAEAEGLARELGDVEAEVRAARIVGTACWREGRLDDAARFLERGLSLLPGASAGPMAAAILNELGTVARLAGRLDEAARRYEAAREVFERLGRTSQVARLDNNLGIVAYLLGDRVAALRWWERFARHCEQVGARDELVNALNNIGTLHRDCGDLERARERLGRAAELAAELGHRRVWAMALGNLGEAEVLAGRPDEAEAHFARCEELAVETGAEDEQAELERRRAELALHRGRADAAAALAAAAGEAAHRLGLAMEEGNARAVEGAALAAQGRLEAAEACFASARALLCEGGARFELARLDLLEGEALVAFGRARDGEARLAAAADAFRDMGARHFLRRATSRQAPPGALHVADLSALAGVPGRQSVRHLELLLDFTRTLTHAASTEAAVELILDRAIELANADRGCLLLLDEGGRVQLTSGRSMSRAEVEGGGLHSTTVVRRVMETRKAVVSADVDSDDELRDRRSIVAMRLRSVMCVPMLRQDRLVGVIYVDSKRLTDPAQDLGTQRLLEAIAEQAALALENTRLFDALKRRADLMGVLAHEFRSPLAAMISSSHLLKDPEVDEGERGELLETMEGQARRLARMVNSILDLARLEGAGGGWEPERVDVGMVAARAGREMAALFAPRSLRLAVEVPGDTPRIWGSADRLVQVLVNLLANAARFSPDGGSLRIEARTVDLPELEDGVTTWRSRTPFPGHGTSKTRFVEVAVLDRGPGIPPDQIETIFEKFAQAGDARARAGGTGLGLAITREIVVQHGGRIWAENREGGGAAVRLLLPEPVEGALAEDAARAA